MILERELVHAVLVSAVKLNADGQGISYNAHNTYTKADSHFLEEEKTTEYEKKKKYMSQYV